MAGQDGLRHGAHADRVGAPGGEHPDLGRRLELRAQGPAVHAFAEHQVLALGQRQRMAAQVGVVGVDHVDEAVAALLAHQRAALRGIDVVGDQHQAARRHVAAQRARGIGLQQQLDAPTLQRADGAGHAGALAAFVGVGPAAQEDHALLPDAANDDLVDMALDLGLREGRQFGIGQVLAALHMADGAGPAGAEHDGNFRRFAEQGLQLVDARGDRDVEGLVVDHGKPQKFRWEGPKLCGSNSARVQRWRMPPGSPAMMTSSSGTENSRSFWRQPPQGVMMSGPGPVTSATFACLPPAMIMAVSAEGSAHQPCG
mmetsp:Transcript_57677/g.135837  ORF Transcript_57677/g.135837 Transcript_57677/m.135837 type:complete len:313 (+) Transcript_57677:330-1268(+)